MSRNFSFFYQISVPLPSFKPSETALYPIEDKFQNFCWNFLGNFKVKIDELNEKFVCQAHEKSVNCVAINTAGTHILVSLKGLEDGPLWIILYEPLIQRLGIKYTVRSQS